jgi:multiple sugar transport system ATP-binding protein
MAGPVQLLEPLGDVTIVSFAPNGKSLRIVLSESRASSIRLGDQMSVRVEPDKIHIFRAHDGTALR